MRIVLQRVKEASVEVDQKVVGSINKGLLVLVGITDGDSKEDITWLCRKITQLRVFPDFNGVMNHNVLEVEGKILAISQFTLFASTNKGNRPSYIRAAKPDIAIPLYRQFIEELQTYFEDPIQEGIFGADMKVRLINDGPITITIDSKNKE